MTRIPKVSFYYVALISGFVSLIVHIVLINFFQSKMIMWGNPAGFVIAVVSLVEKYYSKTKIKPGLFRILPIYYISVYTAGLVIGLIAIGIYGGSGGAAKNLLTQQIGIILCLIEIIFSSYMLKKFSYFNKFLRRIRLLRK